ncbi:MAG: amidohydrolase [Chloroflexi bacterium]|nr:amidohydrolase [Chloroflexota bacterium]
MLTIDTHCHASPQWFEPIEVLLFQMNRNAVDKAALIQHRGQHDNRYLIECARRFPGRFAVVGIVDTSQPDAPDTLARWHAEGVVGLRLNPLERSPGRDPLAIWRKASELGMVVSSLGEHEQYASDEFRKVVEELSNLPIIVEHLGFVGRGGKPPFTTYRKILALSKYPNVYMKVPGLGEIMARPIPARDPTFDLSKAPPFIDMAIEAFGANRLMIGTDYPPSANREGYGNVVRYLREHLSRRTTAEQEAIFGKTAATLFKLE